MHNGFLRLQYFLVSAIVEIVLAGYYRQWMVSHKAHCDITKIKDKYRLFQTPSSLDATANLGGIIGTAINFYPIKLVLYNVSINFTSSPSVYRFNQ
jgi:hypothetical protein